MSVTKGRRQRRQYPPNAFSGQGVAMRSSVLNSDRTISATIAIMRTVVKLCEMMATRKDLARKPAGREMKYDGTLPFVIEAIRQSFAVEEKPERKIGYISERTAA